MFQAPLQHCSTFDARGTWPGKGSMGMLRRMPVSCQFHASKNSRGQACACAIDHARPGQANSSVRVRDVGSGSRPAWGSREQMARNPKCGRSYWVRAASKLRAGHALGRQGPRPWPTFCCTAPPCVWPHISFPPTDWRRSMRATTAGVAPSDPPAVHAMRRTCKSAPGS